ncbi:E3 ubiquitin-protein ligase BRE1 [Neolecta irregularis DAH-3]|uniref:E3 ubiquitin-protein ligase BRE1 n=1 Tax=Neolecta irregularis (strain DAH-3) TaxID=1198029 RepID=A0A1U7LR06_NEOID|nr:E3 ubiquitin-protein ligase BRE1 [Neolecta irregularis DAH-3]|eukprot:OLL25106.1 E3 ubiquitin-protein ligase BRE1 [Neolecta irregularis DAH-3]
MLNHQNQALADTLLQISNDNDAFKHKLLAEQNTALDEMNAQLSRTSADLTRIRSMRDELVSELAMRKAAADADLQAAAQISQLSDARLSRIHALELELDRWKSNPPVQISQSLQEMSQDELLQKVARLEKQNASLATELPALESAFNKAHQLSISKLLDLSDSHLKIKKAQTEARPFSAG